MMPLARAAAPGELAKPGGSETLMESAFATATRLTGGVFHS
jgi:hypothetical protein